jgi:hypothetical protein
MSNAASTNNQKPVPAYVAFCHELAARAQALGLELEAAPTETGLPQNKDYAFVRAVGSTAAFIVPKSVGGVKWVESHIELPDSEPVTTNGRVVCRIQPGRLTDDCLVRLRGASKRPVAQPARKASEATGGSTPVLTDEETVALLTAGL